MNTVKPVWKSHTDIISPADYVANPAGMISLSAFGLAEAVCLLYSTQTEEQLPGLSVKHDGLESGMPTSPQSAVEPLLRRWSADPTR